MLDVADIVEEEGIVFGKAFEEAWQAQIAFGQKEFLYQQVAGREQDAGVPDG